MEKEYEERMAREIDISALSWRNRYFWSRPDGHIPIVSLISILADKGSPEQFQEVRRIIDDDDLIIGIYEKHLKMGKPQWKWIVYQIMNSQERY